MRKWLAVWVGLLFCVTAFAVGFANDDLVHRLWLEDAFVDHPVQAHTLYEFTGSSRSRDWLVAHEYAPWFTDPNWSLRTAARTTRAGLEPEPAARTRAHGFLKPSVGPGEGSLARGSKRR